MEEVTKTEELPKELEGLTGVKLYHAKKKLEAVALKKQQDLEKELKKQEDALKENTPTPPDTDTPKEIEKPVEQKVKKEMEKKRIIVDPKKTYEFELIEKTGTSRHVLLNCTSKIIDPVENRIREIKYIPIADTIFSDQMGDRYSLVDIPILSFHRDKITADGTDTRLIEFLLSHDEYDGNKNRLSKKAPMYTLINKSQEEIDKENKFLSKVRAMNIVNDSDIQELFPIARVIYNELSTDEIVVRNALRTQAESNPEKLLSNIDSPQVKRKFLMQTALDKGIIHVNKDKRSLVWSDNGGFIKEIVATKDEKALLTELADFTFTGDGQRFYDVIKQKLAA